MTIYKHESWQKMHLKLKCKPLGEQMNSFLTDEDKRRFHGLHRSISDCTEHAV